MLSTCDYHVIMCDLVPSICCIYVVWEKWPPLTAAFLPDIASRREQFVDSVVIHFNKRWEEWLDSPSVKMCEKEQVGVFAGDFKK